MTGVPDQSWDESAPAGTGFGQDAPGPPAADDWGSAPAAGAAGQNLYRSAFASPFSVNSKDGLLLSTWKKVVLATSCNHHAVHCKLPVSVQCVL